jgi:hypothetical protein
MATATSHTAARLAQAQSLHRKALAELANALTTYRNAGPEAKGVVELLQRAHDVGTAVLAQLGVDLAKAEAEQPAPKPAPKAEQPKPEPKPAAKPAGPMVPADLDAVPLHRLGELYVALGGQPVKGGMNKAETVVAIRALTAQQPAAKPEQLEVAAHTAAKPEQPARKADPKPAAKPEAKPGTPKADGLAEYRALAAECKAYGLNAKGKADELRARLAGAKAKGATVAAVKTAKAAIPSDAELAKLDAKGLVAIFRKLPVEMQRELLAAAR